MPVYNEIAHIPLIVHLPGDARAGRRVAGLTQTTDLMPTFLDYFGAPTPPHPRGAPPRPPRPARWPRPALEGAHGAHAPLISGSLGMGVSAPAGRHTYFRN